jgi:hypothetical protein
MIMNRRHLFLGLGLLFVLYASAWAQEGRRVLLLPVDVRGSGESLTTAQVTAYLESAVESEAPTVQVILPEMLEASDSPPSLSDARLLAQKYRVDAVAWLAVRFRDQSLPTQDMYMHNLTLSAAARFWVYDATGDSVLLDEPVSVVKQTPLSASVGVATEGAAMTDLKYACGSELASTLVHAAQDARNKNRMASWSSSPKLAQASASRTYQNFLTAFSAYQDAVGESDFVEAASTQTQARQAWASLTTTEKTQAESDYPGIQKWIGK